MLPSDRQKLIVDHINTHGRATVEALAAAMAISRETIRRDLASLAESGLVVKVHGGAAPVGEMRERAGEGPFQARMKLNVAAKRRIAQAAARLFQPGDSLFVDTGSTTVFFAQALAQVPGLSLITNSCAIAGLASRAADSRVFLIGGEYRDGGAENVGRLAVEQIATLRAEHVVLTVAALDGEGAFDYDIEEAEVAKAMLARARRLTVVADAAKLGKTAIFQICPLDRIERVVIEASPPEAMAQALAQAGVEVLIAP